MELSKQIKKYRTTMHLSQEEFAEKIYVTRQTVSNWENERSYPDIHSLLLISSLFSISLDQLIKGDIEIMKMEVINEKAKILKKYTTIYGFLLVIWIIVLVPIMVFLSMHLDWGIYGILVGLFLYMVTVMPMAFKIERIKKENNIQNYKEITAFLEGQTLDEITKEREISKRKQQKIMIVIIFSIVALCIIGVMTIITFYFL